MRDFGGWIIDYIVEELGSRWVVTVRRGTMFDFNFDGVVGWVDVEVRPRCHVDFAVRLDGGKLSVRAISYLKNHHYGWVDLRDPGSLEGLLGWFLEVIDGTE